MAQGKRTMELSKLSDRGAEQRFKSDLPASNLLDDCQCLNAHSSIRQRPAQSPKRVQTLLTPGQSIDRASRIAQGGDTTRVVGIEFDIDASQGDSNIVSNLTGILAWKGFDSTTSTVDSVYFLLGSGRAPVTDSLWSRFTLDTAGTGTGFVIHQFSNFTVSKWLSRGGHLRTTSSTYGSSQGNATFKVFKGTLSGEYTITAKSVPDSSTTVTSLLDFGSGSHAIKVQIHGSLF